MDQVPGAISLEELFARARNLARMMQEDEDATKKRETAVVEDDRPVKKTKKGADAGGDAKYTSDDDGAVRYIFQSKDGSQIRIFFDGKEHDGMKKFAPNSRLFPVEPAADKNYFVIDANDFDTKTLWDGVGVLQLSCWDHTKCKQWTMDATQAFWKSDAPCEVVRFLEFLGFGDMELITKFKQMRSSLLTPLNRGDTMWRFTVIKNQLCVEFNVAVRRLTMFASFMTEAKHRNRFVTSKTVEDPYSGSTSDFIAYHIYGDSPYSTMFEADKLFRTLLGGPSGNFVTYVGQKDVLTVPIIHIRCNKNPDE